MNLENELTPAELEKWGAYIDQLTALYIVADITPKGLDTLTFSWHCSG